MTRMDLALGREYRAARKGGAASLGVFYANVREAIESGHLVPAELSLRGLFEELVPNGRELVQSFNPRNTVNGYDIVALEAAGVVDSAAFSNINGQLLITTVLQNWNNPDLIWRDLVTVMPTPLNGERLAGITVPADEIQTVPEGEAFGKTGLNEQFIDTPVIPKKGTTIGITKEAIFYDRTGLILANAGKIGEAMAMNLEKRVLDVVLGIVNNYRRNGADVINTYQTTSPYVNVKTSNPLVDYRSIKAAANQFGDMVDPDTGEPIIVSYNTLVCPYEMSIEAQRIIGASSVRVASGDAFLADPTDNAEVQTYSNQPLRNPIAVKSNAYVKARTSSASTWFLGDFKRAFYLMENWPIQVIQAPANSAAEFERDIVAQFKVTHKATPVVVEPRHVNKNTA